MKATLLLVLLFSSCALAARFGVYSLSMGTPNMLTVFHLQTESASLIKDTTVATGGNGVGSGTLSSQNALISSGNFLIGVNPMSNSVSLFSINSTNTADVKLIATASSMGEWPVSVAAFGSKACVVNGGAKDGIQCYNFDSTGLSPIMTANMPFNFNLTTPPKNPQGPAQISFSNDGKALIVSNKQMTNGVPTMPIMMFAFDGMTIGPVLYTTPTLGNVPFGFTVDGDGDVVLTDADPYKSDQSGVQLVKVATTGTPSISFALPNYFNLTGQKAACWAAWSPTSKHYYIANAASKSISEMSKTGNTLALVRTISMPADPLDMALLNNDGVEYLFAAAKDANVYAWRVNANAAPSVITSGATGSNLSNGVAVFKPTNAGANVFPSGASSAATSAKMTADKSGASSVGVALSLFAALLVVL